MTWETTTDYKGKKNGINLLSNALKDFAKNNITFKNKFKNKNQRYDILLQLLERSEEYRDYLIKTGEIPMFNFDIKKEKGKTIVKILDFIYE